MSAVYHHAVAHLGVGKLNPAAVAVGTVAQHSPAPEVAVTRTAGGGFTNPVLAHDAPDPTIARDERTGIFHMFTTQGETERGWANMPHWTSRDLVNWSYRGDAMPVLPDDVRGVVGGDVWAPHVFQLPGERDWHVAYSARHVSPNGTADARMAIGLLSGRSLDEPLRPNGWLIQSDSPGHTIDPSVFIDPKDSAAYMYWGSGPEGLFGGRLGADASGRPYIAAQLAADPAGRPSVADEATRVFEPSGVHADFEGMAEGAMVRRSPVTGKPQLWYSGDIWDRHYALKVAETTSDSPLARFDITRPTPVLDSNARFRQPGHHEMLTIDGQDWVAAHAYRAGREADGRGLTLVPVDYDTAGRPVLNDGAGVPDHVARMPIVAARTS